MTVYLTFRVDFSFDEKQLTEEDAIQVLGDTFMKPKKGDGVQIEGKEFSYSSKL